MTNRALPLSQPVFAILSALIEERLGLVYSANDRDVLAEKLTTRAIECGFDSLLDYYYFLRYDPGAETELYALAEVLVINETYFLREAEALKLLVGSILPDLIAERGGARVWCAACSTGEEPLTLAGLLAERALLDRVEIVASDISERALKTARSGRYGRRSVRSVDEPLPAWLSPAGDGFVAAPELVRAVEFRRVNLLDDAAIQALGSFDVIVCRNVLIYFRDTVSMRVVARLEARLLPSGYLLVGASESLLRFGTALLCEERGGVFYYRKSS